MLKLLSRTTWRCWRC